jgi:hypothetical protein
MIALALASATVGAAPASATWWGGSSGGCKWNCTGSTSSSSTTTSTSGGTEVPEPGMLGIFGLGLVGIALSRRRRRIAR